MEQPIIGFQKDDEDCWVAKLKCGHNQHVRHNPPWIIHPWVTTKEGRECYIGHILNCKKCDRNESKDFEI